MTETSILPQPRRVWGSARAELYGLLTDDADSVTVEATLGSLRRGVSHIDELRTEIRELREFIGRFLNQDTRSTT